ncbi:MAG: CDP-alcohol phosphatidyltransferase family protein [Deltaproteobacteria bacterium]|nr:CDP-alcohol phosphatidyltransferase family protein [Deltaproteobacteria bacterium]
MKSPAIHLFHESPVRLWGLSNRERLQRVLARLGAETFVDNPADLSEDCSLVILRGDYLYDDRIIQSLLDHPGTVLTVTKDGSPVPVAAHIGKPLVRRVYKWIDSGQLPKSKPPGLKILTPDQLTSNYMQRLRKFDRPFVLPLTEAFRDQLEEHLFSWSYKGVTDLVTKWLWPTPAKKAVRFCVEHDIKPNQVTLAGFFLAVLAGLFFYQGWYFFGLLAGWLMTFLDTVDGKLARVTVTSSKFGHLFDHAIDIIHPPLWYLAWGVGLAAYGLPLTPGAWNAIVWLIWVGYLGGRLVEAIFTQFFGRFGIFCWQPRDSWFRLITGRRNPCMILLTLGWLAGRPDLGLWAVALWTFFSTVYLGWRLYEAFKARRNGPLEAWFTGIDPNNPGPELELAVRVFTRRPTILPDGSRG